MKNTKYIGMSTLIRGDCLDELQFIPDNSVDSIVTDPPYGLKFMSKHWDYSVPRAEVWRECLRVLKPGGHLLSFGGSRTYHRLACAVEDGGFEIRDQIMWVYGSGFPKSHNGDWGGTALKPAHEPIVVARKPLIGTVEANYAAHGTGGLNIDECRVDTADNLNGGAYSAERKPSGSDWVKHGGTIHSFTGDAFVQPDGRWPANLIHDGSDEVLAAFPLAAGQLADASTTAPSEKTAGIYGAMRRERGDEPSADSDNAGTVGFKMKPGARRLDSGSAARFFYCAKSNKSDRGTGNLHPTVKPTDLMRYLCRLVTPKGGTVLDPFMGSGSTGKASVLEGLRFVGIERDLDDKGNSLGYFEIACKRITEADEL